MKQILCSLSADRLDLLLFATSPAVENIDSTFTDDVDADRRMETN